MFGNRANLETLTVKKEKDIFSNQDIFFSDSYIIKHDVVIFDNFVKDEFCDLFIEFFKKQTTWTKSVTYGETEAGLDPSSSPRQSTQIMLANYPNADKLVFSIFNRSLNVYRTIYEHVEVRGDEGYSLLRYRKGGEYKEHVDRGSQNNRIVSGLLYLNDDFEGGEINFSRYDLTVKPKKGSVILFPSFHTHLHASLPITSGTKYAVVTWFF